MGSVRFGSVAFRSRHSFPGQIHMFLFTHALYIACLIFRSFIVIDSTSNMRCGTSCVTKYTALLDTLLRQYLGTDKIRFWNTRSWSRLITRRQLFHFDAIPCAVFTALISSWMTPPGLESPNIAVPATITLLPSISRYVRSKR